MSEPAEARSSIRAVRAWAFYDFANSAFATTVMAGFFPTFFKQYWNAGVDATVSTGRLGVANAIAGLVVAILAPVLGAIADRGGARKKLLLVFTVIGAAATAALYLIGQPHWSVAAAMFVTASVGFMAANVFYDALMLDVANDRELDRVSALGFALGYLGGGLLFALNLLMVVRPHWFNLATAADAVRASFLTVALWWLLFSIPLAVWVREHKGAPLPIKTAVRQGFAELGATVRTVIRYREAVVFLLAYWFYIDGVNTIIKMAVDFGLAIGLEASDLLGALLLTQFVAFPAAMFFGWLGGRIGSRNGVLVALAGYVVANVSAYFIDTSLGFVILAVLIGLVQGGVQSLSRSLFARLVPQGKNAEFFGFYNMMGKFATVLGPALVALVGWLTHSNRAAILSLLLLFVMGAAILLKIPNRVVQATSASVAR
ncbi:MAG: MFS transporter [Steroidobacteraceae bacterium]